VLNVVSGNGNPSGNILRLAHNGTNGVISTTAGSLILSPVSGSVGIGTAAPQAALDVVSTGTHVYEYAQIWRDSTGVAQSSMTATGKLYADGSGLRNIVGDNLGNHTATQNIRLNGRALSNDGDAEGVYVTNAGNVGIGITNPTTKFWVSGGYGSGDAVIGGTLGLGGPGGDNALSIYSQTGIGGIALGEHYYLLTGQPNGIILEGNIGISTGNPQAKLDIVGPGSAPADMDTIWRDSTGLVVGSMSATGVMMATKFVGPADSLGTHIATTTLNMAGFNITGVSTLSFSGVGIAIATSVYTGANGLYVTQDGNIYTVGNGSGSSVPPGTRGTSAVDLQSYRWTTSAIASGNYSVLTGGLLNTASGGSSFVGGGSGNTASGTSSVVNGGFQNVAAGVDSVVPGGYRNTALGDYSFAAGYYSSSTANGTFTWSDSLGIPTANTVTNRTVFKTSGGFLITGSTNTTMSGTVNRGMLVTGEGLVGISTGVPGAALDVVSTGTHVYEYAQIWRASDGTIVSSMTATGVLYPQPAAAAVPAEVSLSTINASAATPYGGVNITTNTFIQGNVGIGTKTPATVLDVAGSAQFGAGVLKSTFSATPGASSYALYLSSGLKVAAGGIRWADGYTSYFDSITEDSKHNLKAGIGALTSIQAAGQYNIALGNNAQLNSYTGANSIAIGREALRGSDTATLNTGGSNIAIGYYALAGNTNGIHNIAIGESALQNNLGSYYNVALGHFAQMYMQGGLADNVSIG
jgi:hypothetical protein